MSITREYLPPFPSQGQGYPVTRKDIPSPFIRLMDISIYLMIFYKEAFMTKLDPKNCQYMLPQSWTERPLAKKRMMNRVKGHEEGTESVRTIVRTSRKLGIRYLTLYAFFGGKLEEVKA
jgi:hypothetical protein